jgi:iron complex outermembrane recepter protein
MGGGSADRGGVDAGMRRIEVLRGPAGVLYSENDPGDLVNAITKLSQFSAIRDSYVGYGSCDSVEAGIDVGARRRTRWLGG